MQGADHNINTRVVTVRRAEGRIKRAPRPDPPVEALIRQAGFGGLLDLPYIQLDLALITALLERWWPETHTFHLNGAEATVTLQDVEVLLGLPVDGAAVICELPAKAEYGPMCEQLLGMQRPGAQNQKSKVNMTWLLDNFSGVLREGYTEEDVVRQARGYILQLIGGMLAPDHTGNAVPICYLRLLEDLTVVRSWGSACLACLYHFLCKGAAADAIDLGGCGILLQLWAWERFPGLCPRRRGKEAPIPGSPLGARYVY